MMIRSFLPVGQGAFYCEQFSVAGPEKINIVYDCGSLTSVSFVEHQIKYNFQEDEVIHAVFLSHLDADHINGLPYLLKYCNVKKIFFPLLTEENKTLMELYGLVRGIDPDDFAFEFLHNPYSALGRLNLRNFPTLYQVQENNEDSYNGIDAQSVPSGENVADRIGANTDNTIFIKNDWIYIPFNFRREDRIKTLKKELRNIFKRDMHNEDLKEIWKRGNSVEKDNVKAAYRKVKGGFNVNSMTLFSGDQKGIASQLVGTTPILPYCRHGFYCCDEKSGGCLYTGDYNANEEMNWEQLRVAYDEHWNQIGCVQIPHHGSSGSYNSELANLDSYFVISAGSKNRYGHPHAIVLKDLLFHGHCPLVVTEHSGSAVHIVVEL